MSDYIIGLIIGYLLGIISGISIGFYIKSKQIKGKYGV